jgi:2-oxo-4-hydroxy-4-carboxy-5-ureidoimidazoline decarboxylase
MSKLTYTLTELNALSIDDARFAFMNCCTAARWAETMLNSRPFTSIQHCHSRAAEVWNNMEEVDFLEAFDGHPKIGDVSSLRQKYAHTKALATGEQSSVNSADETTIQALAAGNAQYEAQNRFIFIVCATGKSAEEMLELLKIRLRNDRETELALAAAQQALITEIRLNKLLNTSDTDN